MQSSQVDEQPPAIGTSVTGMLIKDEDLIDWTASSCLGIDMAIHNKIDRAAADAATAAAAASTCSCVAD